MSSISSSDAYPSDSDYVDPSCRPSPNSLDIVAPVDLPNDGVQPFTAEYIEPTVGVENVDETDPEMVAYANSLGNFVPLPFETLAMIFQNLTFDAWRGSCLVSKMFRSIAHIPAVFVAVCRQQGRLQEGFLIAIRSADKDSVAAFLREPVLDINKADSKGLTALDYCDGDKRKGVFELICQEKMSQFSPSEAKKMILRAAEHGSVAGVSWALEKHSFDGLISVTNSAGENGYHLAAKNGQKEVLTLLESEETTQIPLEMRKEAFLLAAAHGHLDACAYLLQFDGCEVFFLKTSGGETAFILAAKSGNAALVEMFLTRFGKNLEKLPEYNKGFLWAATYGFSDTVTLFLKNPNLDMNVADDWDRGVLQLAAKGDHHDTARLLLLESQKRKLEYPGQGLWPSFIEGAFSCASNKGHVASLAAIQSLTDNDINATDDADRTSLHLAVEKESCEAVGILLASPEIDVNVVDSKGKTALDDAIDGENLDLVSLFLDKAISHFSAEALNSALRCAVWKGAVDITSRLLDEETVRINGQSSSQKSILSLAVQGGHFEIVQPLVERRRDELTVNDIQAAIAVARKQSDEQSQMVQLLETLLSEVVSNEVETENRVEDSEVITDVPQISHRKISAMHVLTSVALITSLVATTVFAVLAVQGLLLPYCIVGAAAAGTMSVILALFFLYSVISKNGKRRSAEV